MTVNETSTDVTDASTVLNHLQQLSPYLGTWVFRTWWHKHVWLDSKFNWTWTRQTVAELSYDIALAIQSCHYCCYHVMDGWHVPRSIHSALSWQKRVSPVLQRRGQQGHVPPTLTKSPPQSKVGTCILLLRPLFPRLCKTWLTLSSSVIWQGSTIVWQSCQRSVVICSHLFVRNSLFCSHWHDKNLAIANRSRVSCINTNNNIMTLKSGLEVTQWHWKWCHSKV